MYLFLIRSDKLFLVIFLIGYNLLYGQEEITTTPIQLNGLEVKETPDKKGNEQVSIEFNNSPDLEASAAVKQKTSLAIANKEVDMMQNGETFLDPGNHYVKKLTKSYKIKDSKRLGATTTQYFGDYTTKANSIRILCRDHGDIDGDRISISINDKILVSNVFLQNNFRVYNVQLLPGFNKIDFRALNEGAYSPNTAQFAVIDDQNVEISSNEWNLRTGVRASILVIKE